MPSPEQYAANRLNYEKSTGATSPQGPARSSRNTLGHGLTARVVVLPAEDVVVSEVFSKEIVDRLDAQTPLEHNTTEMDDAIRLRKTQKMKGLPHDPPDVADGTAAQASVRCADKNGFVYANAQIASESARRDRLDDSKLAEKPHFNLTEYAALFEAQRVPASNHQSFPQN